MQEQIVIIFSQPISKYIYMDTLTNVEYNHSVEKNMLGIEGAFINDVIQFQNYLNIMCNSFIKVFTNIYQIYKNLCNILLSSSFALMFNVCIF